MNFNLSYWHSYECVYNAYDMVLEFDEFKTYPFITKNQPIMVIDLIEQENTIEIQ